MPQSITHGSEARAQVLPLPTQEIGKCADARLFQCALCHRSHAPNQTDGFVFKELMCFRLSNDRKSPWLVEIAGDFREKFIMRQTDLTGQA